MKPVPIRRAATFLLLSELLLASCRREETAPSRPSVPTISETSKRADSSTKTDSERAFKLVGKVASIDRSSGEVAIAHEEIPDYMPAMTMKFKLAGQPVLEELQVGDKVEGTLRVGDRGSRLTDVVITELAEPPAFTLDTTGGGAVLRTRHPVLKPGQPVPDFVVTTQADQELRLSDLRGHVVVLTFIYTRCPLPDYCPLMDKKFAELARRVALMPGRAEQVRLLSVSFDPEHDTPDVLARHARLVGAKPPLWRFAVASHEELARVAEPLGLTYGPTRQEIIHTLSTAIIDRQGRLVELVTGNRWEVGELMNTISDVLRREPETDETGNPPRAASAPM